MKLRKSIPVVTVPSIPLKEVNCGACIRFAHDTFEEALKADLFWMRINSPEAKDRVRLINLADGSQLERDGDHRVIVHNAVLDISA